ncbi:MAG: hypothetical protein NTZ26_00705 [Candidatus Aminicenantes bacterium]|nr:hypothetical protein [Candidatus Aminicenantes bacterium]
MPNRPFRIILGVAWALMAVVVGLAFVLGRPIWALDATVVGLLLWGVYLLRRMLNLTPLLFALAAGIGIFHAAAVTGLYGMTFFGLEYDSYVHTYNSIAVGLLAYQYMKKFAVRKAEAALMAMLITLGIGLFNELVEFVGYRIGGRGEGWFLLGEGDIGRESAFDNLMTDFLHDFLGMAAGVAGAVLWQARTEHKKGTSPNSGKRG